MNVSTKKIKKDRKLRSAEYYGMQEIYDDLFRKSTQGQNLKNLMKFITSDENILLAYRNIKRNKGSKTSACDNVNISDLEKLEISDFLNTVKEKFRNYQPQKVRRKEILKANGKTRPLGIPSMWDRIVQQCILQVLEPVCEAKFCTRSYGFRPNRGSRNAIADAYKKINQQQLTYVVDVDIKGFFDEVSHTKLMRQLWTLGIHDKQLLVIIRKILKAPIQMLDGTTIFPNKGTPQGGILSPLLANVNLNEFDWWISNQWETFKARRVKPRIKDGIWSNDSVTFTLSKTSKLKPLYLVRYADDFKIFTNTRENAKKIFEATKQWLIQRLKLPISDEKSRITNLKKGKSEFLGFELKAVKKGKKKNGEAKYAVESHMSVKAQKSSKKKLKEQIKRIQKCPTTTQKAYAISKYNSMVIGIHNYYAIATHISFDVAKTAYELGRSMYNRFPKPRYEKRKTLGYTPRGKYEGKDKGIIPYTKSASLRFYLGIPILPYSYVKFNTPLMMNKKVNKYTVEGREKIHQKLSVVTEAELNWLRKHPVIGERATVEYNDNRIARYVAQKGKCGVTEVKLLPWDMHCHHIIPLKDGKDDSYINLIIVKPSIHRLIHATNQETINLILKEEILTEKGLKKLNELRKKVGNPVI